jgi:ferredoxin
MPETMYWIPVFHFAAGAAVAFFLGLFAVTSLRERKPRAAMVSLALLAPFAGAWIALYALCAASPAWLLVPAGIAAVLILAFFLPLRPGRPIRILGVTERVDERDIMFAREEYLPGTEKYETYYAMRPEYKEVDDRIRALPELLGPGGRLYDPVQSHQVASLFRIIEGLLSSVDGEVEENGASADPVSAARTVKNLALRLGADEAGICRLDPMYVYSHVGRGPEPFGAPIENHHRFAVAFTLEMDHAHVQAAPRIEITRETAAQYLKGAQISIALARFIRRLGYPARAHIAGSNYQIMLPPVAYDAGLGEVGRIGYLISRKYGARVRLGAVTTDLPLVPDEPVVFGVQDFCGKCQKCATHCPSGAIPRGGMEAVRGVEKWPLHIEKCFHFWRQAGTDCGICMKVCPYSHPPAFVHNLVRAAIQGSPFARTLSVLGDDLFYGP